MRWWWSNNKDSVISFEVKLYETTNIVEFVYRQDPNTGNLGGPTTGASIGLNSIATGNGNFLSLQSAGTNPLISSTIENDTIRQKPATGQIYRFTPPVSGIHQINSEVPAKYSLYQNYPNPFNPVTNISFSLPKNGFINLIIYDALGREVETLVNEFKQAGSYIVDFNASNLSSGIYFYKIQAGDFNDIKKMILTK
jgi:hypothetical protein